MDPKRKDEYRKRFSFTSCIIITPTSSNVEATTPRVNQQLSLETEIAMWRRVVAVAFLVKSQKWQHVLPRHLPSLHQQYAGSGAWSGSARGCCFWEVRDS
jgi:hypothetical protein